ncbi:MAG: hypothetical protein U0165_11230 [Polyangiaceae bacterium]
MKRPVVVGMISSLTLVIDIALAQPTPSPSASSTSDAAPTAQPGAAPTAPSAAPAASTPSTTAPADNTTDEPAPTKLPPKGGLGSGAPEDAYIPVTYTRRGGLVIGASFGLALTSVNGTPAQFEKRNDAYRLDTGVLPSIAPGGIFLGAAFTDWFSFQLGMVPNSFTRKVNGVEQVVSGGDFRFRLEAWPLFKQGGLWRDLGVGLEFGTGGATVKNKATDETLAYGGSLSVVGVNVFWEAWRAWKFNFGPVLSYDYRTSDTYTQKTFLIGLRTAFYTTP